MLCMYWRAGVYTQQLHHVFKYQPERRKKRPVGGVTRGTIMRHERYRRVVVGFFRFFFVGFGI